MTNTDIVPFATIVVSTEAELRNAVNAAAEGDVIQVVGTIGLPAQLVVPADKNITIAGLTAGATLQYTGAAVASGRVIYNSGTLTLENIIITSGHTFSNDPGASSGGGILNTGILFLTQGAVIKNNFSEPTGVSLTGYGGGIYNDGGAIFINGNASVTSNTANFGGAIFNDNGNIILNDDSLIANNTALSSGGGIFNNLNSTLILNHNSSIFHNISEGGSGSGGGGIYNGSSFTMNDNSSVTYNVANGIGGGIENWGASDSAAAITTLNGNATVSNNEAFRGGGIYTNNNGGLAADVILNDDAFISFNTAQADGGGIYSSDSSSTVTVNDNAHIIGNRTPNGDGGGIYVPHSFLANVTVGTNVIFADNSASQAYEIASSDIPTYNAHIFTHTFTIPFTNGYNNFDISYTNGIPRDIVTVGFDSNGGTPIDGQTLLSGDPAIEPPDPTLPGYTFAGWYVDPELTIPWNFSDPVVSDMFLYAKWEQEQPGTFTVNFNSNGGTPVPTQNVNAGNALIPPIDPYRNCDIFDGWFVDTELTIPWNFSDTVMENMTLYARWISRDCPIPPEPPCPPCPPCVILYRPQCCYQQNQCGYCGW